MKQFCSYCGDPATGTCKRKHLEWIIVLPEQIKPGDVWRHPFRGPHGVTKVLKRGDTVVVKTGQRRTFVIPFLNLPELVKRLVPCGWPTCELHCGKCLLYRESETRRVNLLASGLDGFRAELPQSANAGKAQAYSRPQKRAPKPKN